MAQEIERARALLSALIRDKVLAADEATKSYEAWVSCGDESPFSRFVVDLFPQRGEALRAVLRLESVHGLPNPQAFTLERFEDLLVGQLGIEAGLLSPKLLQTVRAVQDKKVVEGKIRRLDDLLPRAGFDPKMVAMLYQHLRERVLICKGCLGRFPRQEMGAFAIECPRCDYNMLADALEPSGVTLLPEDQREALMASSEAVLETVSVQDRLQRRADRGKKSNPTAVLVVLFGLVGVIGVVIVVLLGRKKKPPVVVNKTKTRKTRKTEKTKTKTKTTPDGPKDGLTITEVRGQDLDLYKRGEFEELVELWKQVKPQPGEDVGQVERDRDARVERLEFLGRVASEARGHLGKLGTSDQAEEDLARLLGPTAVPRNVPPFDGAHERLQALRDQRTKVLERGARERYDDARERVSSDSWARRLDRVKGKSLRGIPFHGQATSLVVTDLNADGFTVKTSDGKTHDIEWSAEPLLSLALTKAAADTGVAADQIELARRALLARDLATAKRALERIGASSVSAEGLIQKAPWSAVVVPSPKEGLFQVRYPTSFAPADFKAAEGSAVRAEAGAIVLDGTPCRLETRPLPCRSPARKSRKSPEDYVPPISVSAEFEEAVPGLTFGITVVARGGTSKTYSVTWGGGEWRLELGRNLLQRGSLPPSGGRKVRLTFDGRELSLIFDGLPVTTKTTTARINEVGLLIAASETVRIRKVSLEAPLDPSRVAKAEADYFERVGREIDAVPVTGGSAAPFKFPVLTGEDPQAVATTTGKVVAAIEAAKAQILAGKVEEARDQLSALSKGEGKSFAPTWYYLAYVDLLRHESALALRAAGEALSLDPRLVEARGLRALALARGLRLDAAEVEASAVLEVRPDQGSARLAQARIALAKADLKEQPEGSLLDDRVRMAQALGAGDPLVVEDSRYLITLDRLYRQARVRKEDEFQVVLSRGSAEDVGRLSTLLGKIGTTLERQIRSLPDGPLIRVLIVPNDYGRLTKESGSQAYFSHELGVLLFPSVPKEETREIVSSVVAAHLAHRVGPAPAWLELGMRELYTAKIRRKRNQSTLRLLKDNRQAPETDWLDLLEGSRSVLLRQKLAWARAWALVEFAGRRVQIDLSKDVAAGEAIPVVPKDLQLESLPKDYLRWVKTQRLKK
jgi:tetratricopeptide (TPR) repeat protein